MQNKQTNQNNNKKYLYMQKTVVLHDRRHIDLILQTQNAI